MPSNTALTRVPMKPAPKLYDGMSVRHYRPDALYKTYVGLRFKWKAGRGVTDIDPRTIERGKDADDR